MEKETKIYGLRAIIEAVEAENTIDKVFLQQLLIPLNHRTLLVTYSPQPLDGCVGLSGLASQLVHM